jgi:tripartite-type tricarboxylate transporter receptor subunit TctC
MRGAQTVLMLAIALLASPAAFAADDFPNKPLRLIVPFPPGTASDFLARVMQQKMTESFNQQIVIDNRPGAGGLLGSQIAQKAAPDGYTLALVGQPHLTNILIRKERPYEPLKDFVAVSAVASMPNVLVIGTGVAAKNVQDLINLARSKPGQLNFGSAGVGSSSHLAAAMFNQAAGINAVHVPFKLVPDIFAEMLAGRLHYYVFPLPAAYPMLRDGKLRPLAVATPTRAYALPDVPTMIEAGLPQFQSDSWFGFIMPAGAPKRIVDRLSAETVKIVAMADTKERFLKQGADPRAEGAAQFAKLMRDEYARLAKVVKEAGVTPQ